MRLTKRKEQTNKEKNGIQEIEATSDKRIFMTVVKGNPRTIAVQQTLEEGREVFQEINVTRRKHLRNNKTV